MSGSPFAGKNSGLDMIKRRVVDQLMAIEYPCVIELSLKSFRNSCFARGFLPSFDYIYC